MLIVQYNSILFFDENILRIYVMHVIILFDLSFSVFKAEHSGTTFFFASDRQEDMFK